MTSSSSDPPRLGEFALIAKLFAPLSAKAPLAFGLTDDAAILSIAPGRDVVVTTDALVEGVHFLRDDPADLIARKALRVNLSDLAAKGARPESYVLSLSVAPWVDNDWLEHFVHGLQTDQDLFGIDLIGGDTTSTPGPLTLSIAAFGSVPANTMIRRGPAMPGDLVFVSGTIGDAGGGLFVLKELSTSLNPTDRAQLIHRYRLPEPRLALGLKLAGQASAALDVSDGLIADLSHIANVSGVSIAVDAARVPLSPACRALWGEDISAIVQAVTSGDDYEIAFTAPPSALAGVAAAALATGVPVSQIGMVEAGQGVSLKGPDGAAIPLGYTGYTHF